MMDAQRSPRESIFISLQGAKDVRAATAATAATAAGALLAREALLAHEAGVDMDVGVGGAVREAMGAAGAWRMSREFRFSQ